MNNWHKHQIYCNNLRIASFMALWQAQQFVEQRSAKYPQNKYVMVSAD